jgi:hypothetical protein
VRAFVAVREIITRPQALPMPRDGAKGDIPGQIIVRADTKNPGRCRGFELLV